MKIGEAFIEVHADTSNLTPEVQRGAAAAGNAMEKGVKDGGAKATAAAKSAGKAIGDAGEEGGKRFGAGFTQGATGAQDAFKKISQIFVAGAFAKGLKDTISAASDLNETVSKSAQIFGQEAVPQLEQFGKSAATAMGQSERAAIDAASSFGLLLQNTGFAKEETLGLSENLTQLAGDFASFFNTSPEDAVYAIGAAFRGETEPIRRYGIFLNDASLKAEALKQGLYDGKGVLDQTAKSHAALAIIMQQSAQAQGDFARTADGAANKERIVAAEAENAKAKIGQGLLPVYKEILDVTGKLVTFFGNLPAPIQQATIALTALAILKGPIASLGGSLATMGQTLISLGPAAAGVIGALGAMYIIFSDSGKVIDDNTSITQKYTAALKDMEKGAASAFDTLRQAVLSTEGNVDSISKLGLTISQVKDALSGTPEAYGRFLQAVEQSAQGSDDATKAFESLKFTLGDIRWGEEAAAATQLNLAIATLGQSAVEELVSSLGLTDDQLQQTLGSMQDAKVAAGELGLSSGDAAKVIDILQKAMDKQKASAKGAADATGDLADSSDHVTEKVDTLSDSMKKASDSAGLFKKALDQLTGGSISAAKATDSYYSAVDDLSKSLKDNGRTLDEHTEKGRANREAIIKSTESAFDLADAMVHQGSTVEEAASFINDNYIPALRQQLTQAGLTQDQVDSYIASLNLTPKTVETAIKMSGQDKAKADLEDHLKRLQGIPKEAQTAIQTLIDQGKYSEAKIKIDELTQPRSLYVQIESNIFSFLNSLPSVFKSAIGLTRKTGGPIPGSPNDEVPVLAHGGEYVLSADVVDAIKNDRPSSGLGQAADLRRASIGGETGGDGGSVYAPLVIQGNVNDREMLNQAMADWQRTVLETVAAGRRR